MSGLQRLCEMYGSMIVNGKRFVWDYAIDKAVPEAEMTKERRHASNIAWAAALRLAAHPDSAEGGQR